MRSKTKVEIFEWIGSELESAYRMRDDAEDKLSKTVATSDYRTMHDKLTSIQSRITTLKDMLLFFSE